MIRIFAEKKSISKVKGLLWLDAGYKGDVMNYVLGFLLW